ncbi:hypothetical protein VPNG_06298 [Cytospora leucostoma]|uniref:Heterokaryon incompatibility domain-containing protein n=1 Tax=Cytospora leucostoma TaxID=1230097 RepID=A0A423X1X7_9PEZI|nr:hypothetical protein VPNG_06298 [Cytospora leucostoma]
MDLLITPADPAFPSNDTPYLAAGDRWDRSHFLTYLERRQLSTIPITSRRASPYLCIPQVPGAVLQTWLFFGLVAEVLGLNEQEDGKYIIDPYQAEAELSMLYEESVFVKEDGQRYITGAKILSLVPLMQERIGLAARMAGDNGYRLGRYLNNCLTLAWQQLHISTNRGKPLEHEVKYSLSALGELVHNVTDITLKSFTPPNRTTLLNYCLWALNYFKRGGWLEGQMLSHGWCSSEIEKVRVRCDHLNTAHYVSRLKKLGDKRDHSRCQKYMCSAFQIDKAWNMAHGREEAQVEAFKPGTPYVAISHVWADGLGNPDVNALPECQVDRIISLVAGLQKAVDPEWDKRNRTPYRLWIDTLCCPVDLAGKTVALERIADVYRNATHVLVLDTSFTLLSTEAIHPAELLSRISCSAWMRRLWTFQEGVLPSSLLYQFADRAVGIGTLLSELYRGDVRYQGLTSDFRPDLDPFDGVPPQGALSGRPVQTLSSSSQSDNIRILSQFQSALQFRTVSVPEDEPLCIATILSLDIARVANENGSHAAQKRMAIVWEMIAEWLGGIPPRLFADVDNPLEIEGFRWAPKSLLAADYQQSHHLDLTCGPHDKLGTLVSKGHQKGLRLSSPGFRAYARPHPGLSSVGQYGLHPWGGTMSSGFNIMLLKEEETGLWYYMRCSDMPLCQAIHTGHCAMIRKAIWKPISPTKSAPDEFSGGNCAIVLIEEEDEAEFVVRRQQQVFLTLASPSQSVVADEMTELATKLAGEKVTADFIAAQSQEPTDHHAAEEKLIKRMKELVVEACQARPEFARAAEEELPYGHAEDKMWPYFDWYFSHRNFIKRTSDNQLWLIV